MQPVNAQQLASYRAEQLNGQEYIFPRSNPKYAQALFELLGYSSRDTIYFKFFYPKNHPKLIDKDGNKDKGRKLCFPCGKIDWAAIQNYNHQEYGVHFVVNGGGGFDNDISIGRSLFCEWDDVSKGMQQVLWQELGLPEPTIQIDSGGKSIHNYWTFETPIPIDQWRSLQADLLDFAGADRQLRNPARTMRLPGCYHIQPDSTTNMTRVISVGGQKYDYDTLRRIIPESEKDSTSNVSQWPKFCETWRFPSSESVPLTCVITKRHRDLIETGINYERNGHGFELACDLIASADYLRMAGQLFDGDPEQLFYQFCRHCPDDKGWNESEWQDIWKSAMKSAESPSLDPDQIENCVKGAVWRIVKNNAPRGERAATPEAKGDRVDRKVYKYPEFMASLKALAEIKDYGERYFEVFNLAKKTGYPHKYIETQLRQCISEKRGYFSSEEINFFSDDESEATIAIVPDFLYQDNVTMVVSQPGTGKSLSAYDFAYNLITGGEYMNFPLRPMKVMIIQLDEAKRDSKERIMSRVEEIYDRADLTSTEKNTLRNEALRRLRVFTRMNFRGLGEFEDRMDEMKPDVVIIDNFREICQRAGVKENEQEAGEFLGDIKDVIRQHNSSLLLIHHEVKSTFAEGQNRSSGHGSITQQCATVFTLEKPKKNSSEPQSNRILKCVKNRLGNDTRSHLFARRNYECSWRFEYLGEFDNIDRDKTVSDDLASKILEMTIREFYRNPNLDSLPCFPVLSIKEYAHIPPASHACYAQLDFAAQRGLLNLTTKRAAEGGKLRKYYSINPEKLVRYRKAVRIDELTYSQGFDQFLQVAGNDELVRVLEISREFGSNGFVKTKTGQFIDSDVGGQVLEPLSNGQFIDSRQEPPKKDHPPKTGVDLSQVDHTLFCVSHGGQVYSIGDRVKIAATGRSDQVFKLGVTQEGKNFALLGFMQKKILLDDLDIERE